MNTLKRSAQLLTGILVATLMVPIYAHASSVSITSPTSDASCEAGISNPVTVSGTGDSSGNAGQHRVRIQWGSEAATVATLLPSSNTGQFTFTFTGSRSFNATGTHEITVNVHASPSPESAVIASDTIEVFVGECPPDPAPEAATLTLTKEVLGEGEGILAPSAFALFAGETQLSSGDEIELEAGTYVISETAIDGYEMTDLACSGTGGTLGEGNELTLEEGAAVTCTITNTFTGDTGDDGDGDGDPNPTGTLSIVTLFVNDDGGTGVASDATISVSGGNASTSSFPGSATAVLVTVDAGQYAVSGGEVAGYAVSAGESCTGTLAAEATVECTVTYDDVAAEEPPADDDGPRPGAHANPDGQVLGVSTEGEVLGASTSCSALLTGYLRQGDSGPQVIALQAFLNAHLDAKLPLTGYFGPMTAEAVRKFQLMHAAEVLAPWRALGLPEGEATGYVYKTTLTMINNLACPDLKLPAPPLP